MRVLFHRISMVIRGGPKSY